MTCLFAPRNRRGASDHTSATPETDPDAVAVGKSVVMMGYPSGPDRLLALLDDAESRGIQQRYTARWTHCLDSSPRRNEFSL